MEASKLRRFANCAVDIFFVLFLFLGLLRLLPAGLLRAENYRFALLAVMFTYYASAELIFKRTLGKVLTNTHLVTSDDTVPSSGQLLVRTFCRFLPLEPLSLLVSKRRLAWHDRISATKVIYLNY